MKYPARYTHRDRTQIVNFQELRAVRNSSNCSMGLELPFGTMKIFWDQIEVVFTQNCECTKWHWIFRFKMANFMLHEFHLKKKIRSNQKRISVSSSYYVNTSGRNPPVLTSVSKNGLSSQLSKTSFVPWAVGGFLLIQTQSTWWFPHFLALSFFPLLTGVFPSEYKKLIFLLLKSFI